MPWKIARGHGCPSDKPFAVVKESDGSLVACHVSKEKAEGQLRALYANESKGNTAMDLFKINGDRFDLSVPITKYDEGTGEFEAWATLEEVDKSNEIIDLDKSWPYFQAHSQKFAAATGGESFGNVREQHDPKRAAGKLIAPPEIRKHDGGNRGVYVKGVAIDPVTKEKLATRVLVGVSIGGSYEGKEAADDVRKGATRYVANPSEYSLVDSPCVENALITVVKSDGREEVAKAVGFNPPQGFLCRSGAFHVRKDEARRCEVEHEFRKDDMSGEAEQVDTDDGVDDGQESRDANDKKKKKAKIPPKTDEEKAVDAGEVEKITSARRKSLPDSEFALPDQRKYPIDTKARARNALARAAQNATPEEQAKIKAAVRRKYPDIAVDGDSSKSADGGLLQKCLSCVSQIAALISNAEGLAYWLREYESQDDGDGAEEQVAEEIEQAATILYGALRDMVDDAQADAQGYDESDQEPANFSEVTDDSPVFQMTALAESLKKKSTIKQLLSKSLRVQTGNGSKTTSEKTEETRIMEKKEEKAAAEKQEQKAAEKSTGDGELSKVATDQIAKAVTDGLTKALEPVAAEVAELKKARTDSDKAIDLLTKIVNSAIINAPAPAKAVKRVTKAEDSRSDATEHDKAEKKLTPLEQMQKIMSNPSSVAYGSGLVSRAEATE